MNMDKSSNIFKYQHIGCRRRDTNIKPQTPLHSRGTTISPVFRQPSWVSANFRVLQINAGPRPYCLEGKSSVCWSV